MTAAATQTYRVDAHSIVGGAGLALSGSHHSVEPPGRATTAAVDTSLQPCQQMLLRPHDTVWCSLGPISGVVWRHSGGKHAWPIGRYVTGSLTWRDRVAASDPCWWSVRVPEGHWRYGSQLDATPAFHRPGLFSRECSVRGVDGGLPSRTVLEWRPGRAVVELAGTLDDGGGTFHQCGGPVSPMIEAEAESEAKAREDFICVRSWMSR